MPVKSDARPAAVSVEAFGLALADDAITDNADDRGEGRHGALDGHEDLAFDEYGGGRTGAGATAEPVPPGLR